MRLTLGLVVLSLLVAGPAEAVDVRLAVAQDTTQLTVGSSTSATVTDENNQVLGKLDPLQPLPTAATGEQVDVGGVRVTHLHIIPDRPDGLVFIGDRWFRGIADIYASGGRLTGLNLVDLESYLYGVVGAEMPASWPIEALKSQAVAARTYALYHWMKRRNQPYDLGDTTRWQVYRGVQGESDAVRRAVDGTVGQVLLFNGDLINAMYHSNSGGHTDDSLALNGENLPYLTAVEDFDQSSPYYRWQVSISAARLFQRLSLDIGELLDLHPQDRTPNGRVLTVMAIGSRGTQLLDATQMRFKLGLKSTFFEIPPPAPSAKPTPLSSIIFNGRGFGHGLGLSQYGARALANFGWDYLRILKHYYRGVEINKQFL